MHDRKATRRKRVRRKQYAERMAAMQETPRVLAKRKALASMLEQIKEDKARGLEWGRVCRPYYRELCRRQERKEAA